ncbi:Gfo/Idh/MocA family oxidoreductase [Sphingomonas sp.]|uniref:Gfo/Idh/MocA family protein n=1 Tax=Sphingomonas sp. TaxID=28214 RepID=UPI002BF7F035|nr:Gfo/Idh/MocA family oxidoreductase [Sphingomonas sp.]HTG37624.1 Gfo/Idh/MocA family oxidoreductase [Sphingomonas sp.]
MTLALGFVGTGWIGRNRMAALIDSGLAHAAAILEPDPACLAQARAIAPDAAVLDDFDAILALPLDGVVIATPSALHAGQSIRALTAGHAVFCQKPLGRDVAETQAVLAAARDADRLLAVDFSYRRAAAADRMLSLIGEGTIGPVHFVDLTFHNAYGPGKPWFRDPALAGGGCVVDLGSHLVDLLGAACGLLHWDWIDAGLFAHGQPISGRSACEDLAIVQLRAKGGPLVRLACSWELPAGTEAVIEMRFTGANGALRFANVNGSFYDFTLDHLEGTRVTRLVMPPDEWGGRVAVDWARRLQVDPRYDKQADDLAWVAGTLDAIYGTVRGHTSIKSL